MRMRMNKSRLIKMFLLFATVISLSDLNAMDKLDAPDKKYSKSYTANELGIKMEEEAFKSAMEFEKSFSIAFDKYQQNRDLYLNSSKGKDIIVTIGNTGAGKSTLLNLLTNQKLKLDIKGYILQNESSGDSFKIGTGQESETLLPKLLVAKDSGMILSDLPGFADTRGAATAIVNSICIREILTNAKSVRFLFVEGEDTITGERGGGLKKTLNVAKELLPNVNDLIGSSLLVITKCSYSFQEDLLKFLQEKLGATSEDKKKDPPLPTLDKLFSLNIPSRIWPFENSSRFFKTDRRTKKIVPDDNEAQESIKYTKESLEENLRNLKKITVSNINLYALLEPGMEAKLSQLVKIIEAIHFLPLFSKEDLLTKLTDNELNELESKIKDDSLKNQFTLKPEIIFIQNFNIMDKNIFDINEICQRADSKIKTLQINIKNEVEARKDAEKRKKQQEELRELQKKRQEYRNSSEYKDMYHKIDILFSELAKKKAAWANYDDSFSAWDIFTLGISYVARKDAKKVREQEYTNTRSDLKKALEQYYKNPSINEKHPRHDEV